MKKYLRIIPEKLITERQCDVLSFGNLIYHCTSTSKPVSLSEVVADANAYHNEFKDDPYTPTDGEYNEQQAKAVLDLLIAYGLATKID